MAQMFLGVKLVGTFPPSGRCAFVGRFDFDFRIMEVTNVDRFLIAGTEEFGSRRLAQGGPVLMARTDMLELHGKPGGRWELKVAAAVDHDAVSSTRLSPVVPAPKNHEDVIECDPFTKEI